MMIKALKSFCGKVSLAAGQIADVTAAIGADLVGAGFAEEIAAEPKKTAKKKVSADEAE